MYIRTKTDAQQGDMFPRTYKSIPRPHRIHTYRYIQLYTIPNKKKPDARTETDAQQGDALAGLKPGLVDVHDGVAPVRVAGVELGGFCLKVVYCFVVCGG